MALGEPVRKPVPELYPAEESPAFFNQFIEKQKAELKPARFDGVEVEVPTKSLKMMSHASSSDPRALPQTPQTYCNLRPIRPNAVQHHPMNTLIVHGCVIYPQSAAALDGGLVLGCLIYTTGCVGHKERTCPRTFIAISTRVWSVPRPYLSPQGVIKASLRALFPL